MPEALKYYQPSGSSAQKSSAKKTTTKKANTTQKTIHIGSKK